MSAPVDPARVEALRAASASYQARADFRSVWSGLSTLDVTARATQQRTFVDLLSPVWPTLEGKDILDFGCGAGRWLRWYLELGATPNRLAGVDVSDGRFAEGHAINPLIQLQQIDGEHLPFPDNSFDLVTDWVVFMAVPDEAWRVRLGQEILRVLRPGGYVFWWETLRADPRLSDNLPLDPRRYFPGLQAEVKSVRLEGKPTDALTPGKRPWLSPLIDWLAPGVTHTAARLGPKPG